MPSSLSIPCVSWEQIEAFKSEHFSPNATTSFFANFIPSSQPSTSAANPSHEARGNAKCSYEEVGSAEAGEHVVDIMMGECGYDEEEEDDLGYYPDGVKRTLTDAQIAIFRHTEHQEMLRAKCRSTDVTANDVQQPHQDQTRSSATPEDYCTHDTRARPNMAEASSAVSLPWDDEDVGAWQSVQQQQEQQEKERGKEDKQPEVSHKSSKNSAVKPIFDAPSGKQFFWPMVGKSG